jgi:hypothetical protein
MSQVDLDKNATVVSYGSLATVLYRELLPWEFATPPGEQRQMAGILISGNSGIGKTALAKSVASAANNAAKTLKRDEHFPLFVWSTGGHSRYIEIPSTNGYTIPAILDDIFTLLSSDPLAYPVLVVDEVLSSDPGFQAALQKLLDQGRMGNRTLTVEQRNRLFIIATGNTRLDGNKQVQANSYFTARLGKCRLQPTPFDFQESIVKTGIVKLHPLVLDFLSSDAIHPFWLKDQGGHKCNPRVLEALSQRLQSMTDPMTGMLDTSDESLWAVNKAHLSLYAAEPVVSELMARNEKLSTLTPISDITADPENCKLPANTMAELMQLMLIESYLTSANSSSPEAMACVPHFYLFSKRLSDLVQPTVSAMVQRLIVQGKDNPPPGAVTAQYHDDLDDWDTTLVSVTLANAFREIDNAQGLNLDVEGIAEITGNEEERAAKQLTKRALASDPIAEYRRDPARFQSAQLMADLVNTESDTGNSNSTDNLDDLDGIMDDLHHASHASDTPPPVPQQHNPSSLGDSDELDWD